MKIAMVSPYDLGEVGGVQNQVLLLAEQMIDRGHQVTIVGPGQLASQIRFVSLGPSRDVRANNSVAPISMSPSVVGRLRRAVARSEVVHVHEPLMPLVGLAARWVSKPVVGTFHADPSPFVRRLYRWFLPLRWHLGGFAALTAVSETARSAVASFGDVAVVANGVRLDAVPPRDRVPGRVVFVGRNDPRKGMDVAIAAVASLRQRLPEVELVVVTPEEVEPSEGVVVMQGLDDAEKRELLATAEAFVAPNRGGESFGLVVAEAMAAGCAVVASDLPAFRDLLGDAGAYARPGDPSDLARVLGGVLDDSSRLQRMAADGLERVSEFSIERTADRYEAIYAGAMDDSTATDDSS